jgi:quinol-cytochrome oxidoreductase complex cytochrome b subunit
MIWSTNEKFSIFAINTYSFLQFTHFVLPLLTAVFMLMHFLMIRKQGISGPL